MQSPQQCLFLSYCREDLAAVGQLRDDLLRAGFTVWWDQDILPSQDWKREIRNALRRCDGVIICLSSHLTARLRSGAFAEMLSAIELFRECNPAASMRLFPVRLSNCDIPDIEIDATRTLNRLQYVDLFPSTERASNLRRLITGLNAAMALGKEGATEHIDSSARESDISDLERQLGGLLATNASHDSVRDIQQRINALRSEKHLGRQLCTGDTLSNRYILAECIGAGGFGTVWKAFDRDIRRLVATKVLHLRHAFDKTPLDRFFRGARQMLRLTHPHIVRVLKEREQHLDYHYFVMEFISGGDFRRAILNGTVAPQRAIEVIVQIGEALSYAHEHGIVHRDVKPANIVLDEAGAARLTDFDLVRAEDTTGFTHTGAMGSFLYASPEAMSSANDSDVRSDVYSLGMTTLFAIYRHELPMNVIKDTSAFIDALECSDNVRHVLEKSVEWDLDKRFASMSTFIGELREACNSPGSAASVRSSTELALRKLTRLQLIEALLERDMAAEQLQRDMSLAHDVQQGYLPQLPIVKGYDLFNIYEPESELSSDFFELIRLPNDTMAIVIGEVSGRNTAGALLAARVTGSLRSLLLKGATPIEAVTWLNQDLCDSASQRFVTMVMLVLDVSRHRAIIVNAGHPGIMHRRAVGGLAEPDAEKAGLPLGVTGEVGYEQIEIEIGPGDLLALYTDGIVEAINSDGYFYTLDRFRNVVARFTGSVAQLGDYLLKDVRAFLGKQPQNDDMCAIFCARDK